MFQESFFRQIITIHNNKPVQINYFIIQKERPNVKIIFWPKIGRTSQIEHRIGPDIEIATENPWK